MKRRTKYKKLMFFMKLLYTNLTTDIKYINIRIKGEKLREKIVMENDNLNNLFFYYMSQKESVCIPKKRSELCIKM